VLAEAPDELKLVCLVHESIHTLLNNVLAWRWLNMASGTVCRVPSALVTLRLAKPVCSITCR
jgi:hypothetical protein